MHYKNIIKINMQNCCINLYLYLRTVFRDLNFQNCLHITYNILICFEKEINFEIFHLPLDKNLLYMRVYYRKWKIKHKATIEFSLVICTVILGKSSSLDVVVYSPSRFILVILYNVKYYTCMTNC